MLTLVVTIPVKPEKAAEFEALFAERRLRTRALEPGNLAYDLFKQDGATQHYVVLERYVDEAAFAQHLTLSGDPTAFMACFADKPTVMRLSGVPGCA